MKPWHRRWYFISIFVVICIALFTLPYTIPLVFDTVFEDGEILGFYGSIIGAVATMLALFLMIQFTIKNQLDERRKTIKPHLQTKAFPLRDSYSTGLSVDDNPFFLQYSNDNQEIQSGYNCLYFIMNDLLSNDHTTAIHALADSTDYLTIKYSISNVGGNSALSIRFSINGHTALSNFSIPVGANKTVYIIFGKELLENNMRKIEFIFRYTDIASLAQYEQRENIWIEAWAQDSLRYYQKGNEYLSEPIEIVKNY